MPTRSESLVTVSGKPSKTVQLLRKRLRQLVRVLLVVTIGLAVAAWALAIWWLNGLNGLPDIGDPFAVEVFRSFSLPDDQNAFTFFQRAAKKLTELPDLPRAVGLSAPETVSWSKADPKLRAWVEENRQALELLQQGAEQAEATEYLAGDPLTFGPTMAPGNLSVLALLEGSRRQEDMQRSAGDWSTGGRCAQT